MFARFWLKTALYRLAPGGYGRYRRLRRERDASYDHGRDMHPVRRRHNATAGWGAPDASGTRRRNYGSYDEYVTHQGQKLDEMLRTQGGFTNRVVATYRLKFFRRFRHLADLLPATAEIVCLGARDGTEVEVLRDLGFARAWGVDLNPGPDNPYVRKGDFHDLDLPDGSVDLVYTNCIDHSFDLDGFFDEQVRVLRPDGYALYDLPIENAGSDAAFETVVWANDDEVVDRIQRRFPEIVRHEHEDVWEWLLVRRTAS